MPRITELYAYVIADADPDDEGVPAFYDPVTGSWLPMMGADRERADDLRGQARRVANLLRKPVRLVRSTALEDVLVVEPE